MAIYGATPLAPGSAQDQRVLIVRAAGAEAIEEGAVAALREAGADWDVIVVPGVVELPQGVGLALEAQLPDCDALIVLGVATALPDAAVAQTLRALNELAISDAVPLGLGLAGGGFANDAPAAIGAAAARAALSLAALKAELEDAP